MELYYCDHDHACGKFRFFSHIFSTVPGDIGITTCPLLHFDSREDAKKHFIISFETATGIKFKYRRDPFPHLEMRKASIMRIYGIGAPIGMNPRYCIAMFVHRYYDCIDSKCDVLCDVVSADVP